jgi:hypothetical protein
MKTVIKYPNNIIFQFIYYVDKILFKNRVRALTHNTKAPKAKHQAPVTNRGQKTPQQTHKHAYKQEKEGTATIKKRNNLFVHFYY